MSAHPTFEQLISRFGEIMAWHFLLEIEQAAGIKSLASYVDPEVRLKKALCAQDSMNEPEIRIAA